MSFMNVFLDDKRSAPKGFYLVRTAQQCIELLESETIDVISLDYNLGHKESTGYKVVKYMVRNKLFPKEIIIHSNSPRGRSKMYDLLNQYKPQKVSVYIRPLPTPH
jgi:hypothetical protein